MMGWLRCRLNRHDWLAQLRAPGTREYVQRCGRCGQLRTGAGGGVAVWRLPHPALRRDRRRQDREDRRDAHLLTTAENLMAEMRQLDY